MSTVIAQEADRFPGGLDPKPDDTDVPFRDPWGLS